MPKDIAFSKKRFGTLQILLLVSQSLVNTEAHNGSLPTTLLIDVLQNLCPGVNICREIQTVEPPSRSFRPGFESCCAECSCGRDCTKQGNCCLPHLFTPDVIYDDTESVVESECLFPTTRHVFEKEEQLMYKSYSMVSSVLNGNDSPESTKCGDVKVAPWGSLSPVFSAKRKQIYKNIICANADGVDDGTEWDAILVCNLYYNDLLFDAIGSVLGMDSGQISEYCHVEFIFKGQWEELKTFGCYVDVINTCKDEFTVPDTVNLIKTEVRQACTSGVVSPYRVLKLYANVFCYICNGNNFMETSFCPEKIDPTTRGGIQQGFIGLLDGDFITDLNLYKGQGKMLDQNKACLIESVGTQSYLLEYFKKVHRKENHVTVTKATKDIKRKQLDDCREALCPSGRLHDRLGGCRFPHSLWYDQDYTVSIQLSIHEHVNILDVISVLSDGVSYRLQVFESPWRNNWHINQIFSEIINGSRNNKHFLVTLTTSFKSVNPWKLISTIKTSVNGKWKLKHGNETYIFESSFMRDAAAIYVSSETNSINTGNGSKVIKWRKFQKEYDNNQFVNNDLVINKLYMCRQVELLPSEFVLSEDKYMLYNKLPGTVLHDSEFTLIVSREFEGIHARVCIEDSGMYLTERMVSQSIGTRMSVKHLVMLSCEAVLIQFLLNYFNP